jgi:hypothetical protein
MKFKGTRFLALLGVLAVAACGDDPTGTSNLSEAEAQELAAAVLTAAFTSWSYVPTGPAMADGPALAPYEYSDSWEGTAPCAGGGNVAVSASVSAVGDDETGETDVDMELSQVHNNCVVQSGQQPFTLNGNPSLVVDLMLESDGDQSTSFDGGINGALDYEYDGRSGTCSIAYEFAGNMTGSTGSWSVNGNVCGVSVEQQLSFGG